MSELKLVMLFLTVFCLSFYNAEDLSVGTSINNQLAYTENVRLSAIPLTARTKNVFYSDNSTRTIKGIWAIDIEQSSAKATLTSGGVGFSFANIRIKSQRGDGLNYQVQIFV